MKLALLTPFPPEDGRITGGVHGVAFSLIRELRTFPGLEIRVFHCHSEIRADRIVSDENVTIHFLAPAPMRFSLNTAKAVSRLAGLLREFKPDVVHAHQPHYAVAGFKAGFPTLYTIHGIAGREAGIRQAPAAHRLSHAMLACYDRRAVRQARHLAAISPYVIREYRGRTGARWHLVDNPVAEEVFDIRRAVIPGRILFVGNIGEGKNLLTLLRAAAALRRGTPRVPFEIRLAGPTISPRYDRRLRDFAAGERLGGFVSFLGPLGRLELFAEYASAEIVVLPSRQETRPLALMEAMAAGIPVVASRAAGIPDLVEDGSTGLLFPPEDPVALADALGRLIEKPLLGRDMGLRGRAIARAHFRAADIARRYREIYGIVAADASASAGPH